jgi:hypothetical protein
MARVRFASYALEQIRERGLARAAIQGAITNPDQVLPGKRTRLIAQKRMREDDREYLLRVVYEEGAGQITVVTAYKTSKVDKYWRKQ